MHWTTGTYHASPKHASNTLVPETNAKNWDPT